MTSYKGYNGDVTVEGETLTISRSGMVARAAFGNNVEPVVLPLQAISGVRVKPATRFVNGWLQLVVGGVDAAPLETKTAASNGHTVMFTHKNKQAFEGLGSWLESVIARNAAAGVDPSAYPVSAQAGQVGRFDRLGAKAAAVAAKAVESETARKTAGDILFEGTSHDSGRNARVTLYGDRLERIREAKLTSFSSAKQNVEVTPTRSITSVHAKKDGVLFTEVTAYASGNNIEFRFAHKEASKFVDTLMSLILGGQPGVSAPITPSVQPDVMEQLGKLGDLRDAGILTEDEFLSKKTELLGRL